MPVDVPANKSPEVLPPQQGRFICSFQPSSTKVRVGSGREGGGEKELGRGSDTTVHIYMQRDKLTVRRMLAPARTHIHTQRDEARSRVCVCARACVPTRERTHTNV